MEGWRVMDEGPTDCPYCGSHDNYRDVNQSGEQGFVYEYERRCNFCNSRIGWWAYGGWDPNAASKEGE